MDFNLVIKEKGLKIKWVAEKIGCNYNTLRSYLSKGSNSMPNEIEKKLKQLLG